MIRNGVGARLRLYRQLRNMTQESLSEVMGVTKQHLGQIERGQCNPSLDFLFKAAFALNTQVANFFLGNNHDSSGDCTQGCDEPARDVQPFAGCGLWTVAGPAGRDVWSPSLCRMLGYTSVRFPSLAKFSRHLTPGCTGIFKTFFDQAAAASSPLPVVVDLTRKDGVLRKVLAQAETLPDNSQGHTACIVFWDMTDWLETWRLFQQTRQELGETIRDRTAALTAAVADAKRELELRQEAERSAQQAHENLSRLIQTIPVIVYSRSLDGSASHYCSPQALKVLGYSPETFEAAKGLWTDRIHPDDALAYQEAVAQATRSGVLDIEYRVLDKSGNLTWLHDKAVMTQEDGRLAVHGVAADITRQKLEVEARKALERTSRQLGTLLRLICDNVPDLIWAKDLEKKYIFANKALCETLLGAADTDEPLGRSDLFFAQRERAKHPDNPDWHSFGEICRDTDQITMDAGKEQQFDEYGNVQGKFLFLDVRKAPLFDETGVMIGTVGSARDVTAQKRMEKELAAGNVALRAILDSIPADICVLDVATDEVLFMNASMREGLGDDAACRLLSSRPYGGQGGDPAREAVSWEAFDAVTGKWNLHFDRPVSWFDGRPARIHIVMDITARKQAHALVEKAAEEQRILLNYIQTQTWYLIDAQTYGAVNEAHAAFNGLSIGDMAYRNIYEIFPRDVADICRQGNEKVFSTGLQLRSEEWVPHFSGERRLVSILKSPKLRADGTVEYVVCSGEDITEHRRFEEALKHAKEMAEEASRAKSGFLATMSHEIRTPINGIMGMLQLLQTANLNPDQAEFTDMAVRSCDRLVRLLSDIMDFSRIESGKLAIQAAPMSIESVFGQVRELFTPIVGNNGLALNFLLDPALSGPVIGDAFRLQQILNNLVDNACKFTPTGHITVQAWTMPGFCPGTVRVFFEVSDTGIGIPDAEQDRLFDPFIQVNESYVRSRRGVGLGLSICKRLVELMGGCMSLISEEGRGTSFAFSLPFGAGSDMACPKYVNDRQVASLAGRRVLLVEDDQVSAVAGVALLGRHGAEVTHARSGREALNALRAQTFDLVLMDVQMQDMDGTEVTRLIRAGKAGEQARNIPVIALTACAMAGDRERFIAAGMNNYVAKPMDIREMLKVAGQVMGATQDSARIK